MIKELKPLFANLQKAEYGYFLQSNSFENILLQNDFDELWNKELNIANDNDNLIYTGDTLLHENTFR